MVLPTLSLLTVVTAFGLATAAAAAPLDKPPSLVLPADASTSTLWTLNDDESSRKVLLTLGVMSRWCGVLLVLVAHLDSELTECPPAPTPTSSNASSPASSATSASPTKSRSTSSSLVARTRKQGEG